MANVYLPPASSLRKRGISELDARAATEDTLAHIPACEQAIISGDFNCRVGSETPTWDDVSIARVSPDGYVCPRAPWMLKVCGSMQVHISNGI